MTVIAPMMKTEKNSAVLVQNLSESQIPRMIIGGVQQGLIPLRADLHIRNPDNWPRSFHSDVFIGLTRARSATARARNNVSHTLKAKHKDGPRFAASLG